MVYQWKWHIDIFRKIMYLFISISQFCYYFPLLLLYYATRDSVWKVGVRGCSCSFKNADFAIRFFTERAVPKSPAQCFVIVFRNRASLCVALPSAEEEEDITLIHAVYYLHKRHGKRSTALLRHEKGTVLVPLGKLGRKWLLSL